MTSEDAPASVPSHAPAPSHAPTGRDTLALVAVAGIGTRPTEVESVTAALEATRHALEAGATCLDAAVVGVAALEDDPALNTLATGRTPPPH